MALGKRSSLPAVTGVRFLLAMWVVMLHMATANLPLKASVSRWPAGIRGVIDSGASAVGVFFLLSGFVLAYNYDLGMKWSGRRRREFWLARLARVYPVYCFALLLAVPSLVAGMTKAGPVAAGHVSRQMMEVLLLVQAWVPDDALFWGGAAWSLSVEAFFYLCFPFLGAMFWRVERRSMQVLALLALWGVCCVSSFEVAAWRAPGFLVAGPEVETVWTEFLKWNPMMRLPEFLAGVVLCKLLLGLEGQPLGWLRPGRGWMLYAPAMAVMLAVVAEARLVPPAVLHDGLLLPASAALILGLSVGGGALARWLSTRTMVLLGQVSYAIYLLHMPVYSYFAAAGKRVVRTEAEAWAMLVAYAVCLMVTAWMTFVWVEEKGRRAILGCLAGGSRPVERREEAAPVSADPM